MQPRSVALLVTFLPLLAANVSYLMSATAELVPACIPYIEGCTSISRSARRGDAIFVFRATMIACAVLLIWYWRLVQLWLAQIETVAGKTHHIIFWLGCVGALFLILYTDFLGTKGDMYRLMRRYGIIFFFSFTPIAQLLLVKQLLRIRKQNPGLPISKAVVNFQLILCATMLICGITSAVLDYHGMRTDQWDNILEWNFALCLFVYFFGSYIMWGATGFRIKVSVANTSS
ncbi:MAG: hypothetical protein ACR2P1_05290 [Pseudomonadales bacterium]